jgi:CRISPR-associated endonuclease/helicase Cas3
VFLFKLNEPGVLYKHDERFDTTRNKLSVTDHKDILKNKDFGKLYNLVLNVLNNKNNKVGMDNFQTKYLPNVQALDYEAIHKDFQLIEQRNLSVFVPLSLPVTVEGEQEGTKEDVFTKLELGFLEKYDSLSKGDKMVDGTKVWSLYRQLNEMKLGYTEAQVQKKIMQGILSKFTFSIFYTESLKTQLRHYANPEVGFEDYLYLHLHREIYDYHTGLDQNRLKAGDDCIL